ncbi:MAG TPA: 50S ribosomal protein L9 [Nitrospiria bacterium]|nr:50S ribosomal protein L9 [Nitrospiria bacterium]
MKVILKEDVDSLGRMGDMVSVKSGYARNFLLPQNKAVEATKRNVKTLEHEKRLIAVKANKIKKEFEVLAQKIQSSPVTIPVQVGEEGKLFGSVTNKDIAEALSKQGVELDKRKIELEGPLKEVGEVTVPVRLHHDVTAKLKVSIVSAES